MTDDNRSDEEKFGTKLNPKIIKRDPLNHTKIPLDLNHTCPMCDGKGYIQIVEELKPKTKMIVKINPLGNWPKPK